MSLLVAVPAVAEPVPSKAARWLCDLRVGDSTTTLLVYLTADTPPSASVSLLPSGPDGLPVQEVTPAGSDRMALSVDLAGSRMRFELPRYGNEASGTLGGAENGTYLARRLASDPVPESVEGAYRDGEQSLLVGRFAEFGPWLFLVDLATGEVGPLFPIGSDRFVWGASVVAPALPERAQVAVAADGRLVLNRAGEPPRSFARERFARDEIRFRGGEIDLGGTITRPAGPARPPGIVLLHGSGPEDRHYLALWTQFFASRGLAVLAYDKRGTGASQGDWNAATLEELAQDAEGAVRSLRARPDVDATRVGVFGISQGGWLAPQVAAAIPDLGFVIVHAGAAVSPATQGEQSLAAELRAYELPADEVEKAVALNRLSDDVTRGRRLWSDYKAAYDRAVAEKAEWIVAPPDPADSPFRKLFRGLLDFDPVPFWKRVRCPVLAFFGGKDWIVPAEPNAAILRRTLESAGHLQVEVRTLLSANHVMLEAKRGLRTEYSSCLRFVPDYFRALESWLDRIVLSREAKSVS